MNRATELSITFDNGTKISSASSTGFDSLFDATLTIRNAHTKMESLRVQLGDELVEKEKQAKR